MAQFSLEWVDGKPLPKLPIMQMLGYRWFEEVVGAFHASTSRIKIPLAPARTSKSLSTTMGEVIPAVPPAYERWNGKLYPKKTRDDDDRRIWIVGPAYNINKEFDYAYRKLVVERARYGFDYHVKSHSYSPKQGNMQVVLDFGKDKHGAPIYTLVEGKSSTNPESLESEEVDMAVLSEAAEHEAKIWNRHLATRTKIGIFPTTPKIRADWLREESQRGLMFPELGIETFQFTPKCNPVYDWTRYWQEHGKAESRVEGRVLVTPADNARECHGSNGHDCFDPLTECAAMQDPLFAEQFGGRWAMEEGRVLPFRWDDEYGFSHVLDAIPDGMQYGRTYVSMDYGYNDPAVAIWWSVGTDGEVVAFRELYERGLDPQDFVATIKAMSTEKVEAYIGDPQQPQVESFLRKLGLPVYSRNKPALRDRAAGALRLIDALSLDPHTGRPRLRILSEKVGGGYGCPRTIHEWKTLRRKTGLGSHEWSTASIVGDDHAFDAGRYFFSSNITQPNLPGSTMDEAVEEHIRRNRTLRRQRVQPMTQLGRMHA